MPLHPSMSSPKKTKTTKKAFSSVSIVDFEQVNLGFDETECLWIQCKESSVTTLYLSNQKHCVKCVQIRSYFWSVFSCIRTEYRKIRTRNNSLFGHFSRSETNNKNALALTPYCYGGNLITFIMGFIICNK